METSTFQQDQATVMRVSGRLDAVTTADFERESAALSGERIVLDLAGLEYISSAGLRSILALAKRLKTAGGSLSVSGLSGLVEEVFQMSGFDSFLPLYPDVETALAAEA